MNFKSYFQVETPPAVGRPIERVVPARQRAEPAGGNVSHRASQDARTGTSMPSLHYYSGPQGATGPGGEIFVGASSESWLHEAHSKLRTLAALPYDWDGQGASPPNTISHGGARRVLELLHEMSFQPQRILPSVEEGICISFSRGNRYADIECFNSGDIAALVSDGTGNPQAWPVVPDQLRESLERLRDYVS